MIIHSTLMLLLVTPQDTPKADAAADRARRAAIVDRIMAEPPPLRTVKVAPVQAPSQPAEPPIAATIYERGMRLTLESKEDSQAEGGEEEQPARPAVPLNIRELALARSNFDRWVFGDGISEEIAREYLRSVLSRKIDSLEKAGVIDLEQSKKLRLAGGGDIKHFFDRVKEGRSEFEAARKDFTAGRFVLLKLEPFKSEYQLSLCLSGQDSFLEKTLRRMGIDAEAASQKEKRQGVR
jgi:hypothetical protein